MFLNYPAFLSLDALRLHSAEEEGKMLLKQVLDWTGCHQMLNLVSKEALKVTLLCCNCTPPFHYLLCQICCTAALYFNSWNQMLTLRLKWP